MNPTCPAGDSDDISRLSLLLFMQPGVAWMRHTAKMPLEVKLLPPMTTLTATEELTEPLDLTDDSMPSDLGLGGVFCVYEH